MNKIKILYSGESTGAASGFGIYGHNILSRLVKNPKFHIAEFASFGSINDGKYKNAKWRYYPNAVDQGHPEYERYNQSIQSKYGAWRFERVLLDFKPDIVFTIRDPWMMEHEHRSPLREFYHLSIMPTVDSAPQQHSWIEMFASADSVFTYSDWAIPVLRKQSNEKIKPICSAYPGVEFDTFFPSTDKQKSKAKYNLPTDSFIIGTVMRNQRRKLLEDLFMAFKIYLEKYGETPIGKKTFLLVHTSYPDFAGWNIQDIIKDYGISNKVYFTYLCATTNKVLINKFNGIKSYSPYSKQLSATMPSVGKGVTREQLADIYRCMDLYCQYAICFAKDQEVKTKRGWIPIQDVVVGDECWTKESRWRQVLNKWENLPKSIDKEMVEIEVYGSPYKIRATNNHPFPAYTKSEFQSINHKSVRKNIYEIDKNNKILSPPGKYEIKDLTQGDMLLYPIDDTIVDITHVNLSNLCTNNDIVTQDSIIIKYGNNHQYPRYINVDFEFCKFLGLYVADGTSNKTTVSISSHKNNKDNILLSENILKRITNKDAKTVIKGQTKSVNTYICSSLYAKFFKLHCKKKQYKQLPEWCENLPTNKQIAILQGLFMGDGYYNNKKNCSEFTTISQKLADQIELILQRLRLPYGYSITKRSNKQIEYRFAIAGNIREGEFPKDQKKSKNYYINNWRLIQIKNIKSIPYNDNVYNLDIKEDKTFAVRGSCAYNCEGL